MLGVQEYILYDPLGDYSQPPLHGYRLHEGEYGRVQLEDGSRLRSQVLGLELRVEMGQLRVLDPTTGEPQQGTRIEDHRLFSGYSSSASGSVGS